MNTLFAMENISRFC